MDITLAKAAGSLWNVLRPALLAATCALVAACGQGVYYAEKPEHVRAELRDSAFPTFFFGSQVAEAPASLKGDDTVVWDVLNQNDQNMLRLSATITADGDGSRVAVDVLPPPGINKRRVEQGLAENPSIVDLYRAVVAEHVDATLKNHDFNMGKVTPAMMAATFANMPRISKQMSDAGDEMRREDEDKARHAPAGEANPGGHGGKFGDPMDSAEPGAGNGP